MSLRRSVSTYPYLRKVWLGLKVAIDTSCLGYVGKDGAEKRNHR